MPSDRVVRALLSKTMMAREDIDLLSEKQAWNLLYEASPPKAKDQRSQVCFTGFRKPEKSDRGRERLSSSPPSELCVRFSRTQLSSRQSP